MISLSLRMGFTRIARALGFTPTISALEPSAPPPSGNFVVATGAWSDSGQWVDADIWKDA